MISRIQAHTAAVCCAVLALPGTALAQRPPSPGGQNKELSFEKALDWLLARPGVMVALAIIVAALLYMIITQRRSRT